MEGLTQQFSVSVTRDLDSDLCQFILYHSHMLSADAMLLIADKKSPFLLFQSLDSQPLGKSSKSWCEGVKVLYIGCNKMKMRPLQTYCTFRHIEYSKKFR